jgi:flagellar motor switch protein FliM
MKKQILTQQSENKFNIIGNLVIAFILLLILFGVFINGEDSDKTLDFTMTEQNIRGRDLKAVVAQYDNIYQFCANYALKANEQINPSWIEQQCDERNYRQFNRKKVFQICKLMVRD